MVLTLQSRVRAHQLSIEEGGALLLKLYDTLECALYRENVVLLRFKIKI